jgi:hypothetical protein
VDVSSVLKEWFSDWGPRWRILSINAELRLPDQAENENKAAARLETPTHVASVTAWGIGPVEIGTLELIVMDLGTQSEVISRNDEFETHDELRRLLNECGETLAALMIAIR